MYPYTTTFQDFKHAQRLCVARSPKSRFTFLLWFRILPVMGASAVLLLIWDMGVRHFSLPAGVGGILFGLAWLGLYPVICRPFQLRRLYKQMKNGRDEATAIEIGLEGEELISRVPGTSEGRFLRPAIRNFVEDENVAVLFIAEKKFLFVPKRAMPEGGWNDLRAWIQNPAAMRPNE